MRTDVLVIGAGPAGLAAAYEIASRGPRVTIVDEGASPGGQLRQQTHVVKSLPAPFTGLRGYQWAEQLAGRIQPLAVECLLDHEVVGLYEDGSVGVYDRSKFLNVVPRCIVVATGAAESAVTFPGWTLPGVMTVGAAQTLINRERVYPGKTTLVVGLSDMALQIAGQMQAVGIRVLAVAEPGERIRAGADAASEFQSTGIPILLNTEPISAGGRGKVQEIILRDHNAGEERRYAVDFLCLDGGRQPILEAFSLLQCEFAHSSALGGWLPRYGSDLQTSAKGVFVAGQSAGISSHAAIYLTGALAGLYAVDYLEGTATAERKAQQQSYWGELERIESTDLPDVWQGRLSHMRSSAPPAGSQEKRSEMDSATHVCRCEDLTVADVEDAIAQGARTFDDVKRLTRIGMGPCQAKTCHAVVLALLAERVGAREDIVPVSRLRMPLRLVSLAALADAGTANTREK